MIIWLASYPRSGNTALRILLKAKFGLSSYSEYDDPLDIAANPGVSATVGHVNHGLDPEKFFQKARKSRKTYLIKTHGHPTDGSKAIYVVRDGRSAIVSFRHWFNRYLPESDVSLQDLIAGRIDYGPWSAHVEAWSPETRPDTLLLTYKDVIHPSSETLDTIAAFLGVEARTDGGLLSFEELNARDPGFFRKGSDTGNLAEMAGADLELFWWLHGPMMVTLGFADSLPEPTEAEAPRRFFLREVARPRAELDQSRGQSLLISSRLSDAEANLRTLEARLASQEASAVAALSEAQANLQTLEARLASHEASAVVAANNLSRMQKERDLASGAASQLSDCLQDLAGSRWLKVGHKLKVTRSLQRVRTELARVPMPSARDPEIAAMHKPAPVGMAPHLASDPPEVVAFHAASTARALQRISGRGLRVATVIDVGVASRQVTG